MAKEYWEDKHYSFFQNRECEYFPCHSSADQESFNCLFCYCPFYLLGDQCQGNFTLLPNGFKDCTNCTYPHQKKNYGDIISRYGQLTEAMAKMNQK